MPWSGLTRLVALGCLAWFLAVFSGLAQGHGQAQSAAFDLADLDHVTPMLGWMEYLPDPDGRLSWEEAMADTGWRPLPRPRLGHLAHPIWTRLEVVNSSPRTQTAILFNQRAMVRYLTVTVLDGDTVLERRELGFFEPSDHRRAIIHRLPNIALTLRPGEKWTVLARLDTPGMMEADWIASTVAVFSYQSLRDSMVLGLFTGIMPALAALGLLNALAYRQSRFLIFMGYALFFLLFMLTINGTTRIFGLGLPGWFWVAIPGASIFASALCWISFTCAFLNTAQAMPQMHRWLRLLHGVFVAAVAVNILGAWWPELFQLSPVWIAAGLILHATILVVGVVAVRRQVDHAWFYLLGHAALFVAAGQMAAHTHGNLIHDLSIILLLLPVLVVLHMMTMVLSLIMLAREAQARLDRQERLLIEQSRFTVVGRTIGMLAHQWLAPLARLGAHLTELTSYFRYARDIRDHVPVIRDDLLPSMQGVLDQMTGTVHDFQDFFSARRPSEEFDPEHVLNQVLDMLGDRIASTGARTQLQIQSGPRSLTGHPAALAHVLMVLVGNALEMFSLRGIREPLLTIALEHDPATDRVALRVADNAGGITVEPTDLIFEDFYSEQGRHHSGMGLGIAKKLVEERMNGTITAENITGGARFTVRIPQGGRGGMANRIRHRSSPAWRKASS